VDDGMPDIETLTVEECSAHLNELRTKLLEDENSVSEAESRFAIRCMRKIRVTATLKKGSPAAKAAVVATPLSDF
tara:strand:- start:882 stop:1106 length:225 start_codon:yes stop_codon:yes gene_type:complete